MKSLVLRGMQTTAFSRLHIEKQRCSGIQVSVICDKFK